MHMVQVYNFAFIIIVEDEGETNWLYFINSKTVFCNTFKHDCLKYYAILSLAFYFYETC